MGARGIGEPPVAAGACAILNALSDALGDDIYRRAPVTLDTILMALEHGVRCRIRSRPTSRNEEKRHGNRARRDSAVPVVPALQHRRCAGAARRARRGGLVLAGGMDSFDWLKDRTKRTSAVVELSQIAGSTASATPTAASRSAR